MSNESLFYSRSDPEDSKPISEENEKNFNFFSFDCMEPTKESRSIEVNIPDTDLPLDEETHNCSVSFKFSKDNDQEYLQLLKSNYFRKMTRRDQPVTDLEFEIQFTDNFMQTTASLWKIRDRRYHNHHYQEDYSFFFRVKQLELVVLSASWEKKVLSIPAEFKLLALEQPKSFVSIKAVAYSTESKREFFVMVNFGKDDCLWVASKKFFNEITFLFLIEAVPIPKKHLAEAINDFMLANTDKMTGREVTRVVEAKQERLFKFIGFSYDEYTFSGRFIKTGSAKSDLTEICAEFEKKTDAKDKCYLPYSWTPDYMVNYKPFPDNNEVKGDSPHSWRKLNFMNYAKKIKKPVDIVQRQYYNRRYENELKQAVNLYAGPVSSQTCKLIHNARSYLVQLLILEEIGIKKVKIIRDVEFKEVILECTDGVMIFSLDDEIRACCVKEASQMGFKSFNFDDVLDWVIIFK